MSYFAFTSGHPATTSKELRDAGYDAFAVMMMDRRQRHRHAVKGQASRSQKWEPRQIVALKGYLFCAEPDLWHMNTLRLQGKLRYLGQPVRFCGKFRPIRASDLDRVLSHRGQYFRDDQPPAALAHRPPSLVSVGDVVRFDLAAETIEAPVMSVDGETLLVKMRTMILGRETARVNIASVEKVA